MNDKELQTTDNAIGQGGHAPDEAPLNDQVTLPVAELSADAAAESSVEFSVTPDAEASGELVASGDEVEWLSPDTLPGEVFAARREELRWPLEEAATRLKLTPRQVSALEANDFASLPGMASVRGFIRSYAKALGLDPEPLLAMVAREPNPAHGPMVLRRPLPTKGFPGRPSSPPPRKSKWRNRIIFAVVFLASGVATGFEAYRSQWVQLPSLDDLAASVPQPDTSSIVGSWLVATSTEVSEKVAAIGDQMNEAPAAETSEPAPAPAAARALQLKLSEDAWVEITTISGHRIVSQLIKGGSTASFDIPEPSVLVVGNASAVEARLRGQLLNLKAVARDNVSKLSIK